MQTDGWTNSLMPFQSKRAHVWQCNVASNNKTYLGLHVEPGSSVSLGLYAECPIVLYNFSQIRIFWADFHEVNIKFHRNPSSRSVTDMCRQTNRLKWRRKWVLFC